jgi:hypothetical protein
LAQQTGHKLRLAIPETAVFSSGVLQSWLHSSNKTGVLSSVPRCQHSIAALQQRLTAPHVAYEAANPEGWVAVAHFSDGLSWLVDAAGLQSLLSQVYVGAAPTDDAEGASCSSSATEGRELQLLQASRAGPQAPHVLGCCMACLPACLLPASHDCHAHALTHLELASMPLLLLLF